MAFSSAQFPSLDRHAAGLEQTLSGIIKQLELGIHVQVETISAPMVMTMEHSTDFIFTAKTTLNEAQNFEECGLPFRIRLKALLKTLVVGLPHAFPSWRWSLPANDPKNRDLPELTVENLESTITFSEITHICNGEPSRWLHGTRFRIRATETLEARLARK